MSARSTEDLRAESKSSGQTAPPPPPRRRPITSYNTANNRRSANRLSGAGWDDGSDGGNLPASPGEAGMTRKEFLWHQRWARAKSVLERQGVTLRSWRVGIDVADVCVKLVEQAQREIEREEKKRQYQQQSKR